MRNLSNTYKVVRYSDSLYNEWNDFVKHSKNGTFLFHRDFMEYHKGRFEDFSLLIFKNKKIQAVLPANRMGKEVYSHQGLTYGGLILPKSIKFEDVNDLFRELLFFLENFKIKTLFLKQIPSIYNSFFSEEIDYLMFLLKAKLLKMEVLSVIPLDGKLQFSKNRFEGFKKGIAHGLVVREEQSFELFWNEILVRNLKKRYKAVPVHTLEEITLLKKCFPNNIRQFNVYYENSIVAGTTIFESEQVARCQYISGDSNRNKLGSLDFLHRYLIEDVFKDKKYFDFGASHKNNGLSINKGLQFWKEGFGARTVIQSFYSVDISNYQKLDKIFI